MQARRQAARNDDGVSASDIGRNAAADIAFAANEFADGVHTLYRSSRCQNRMLAEQCPSLDQQREAIGQIAIVFGKGSGGRAAAKAPRALSETDIGLTTERILSGATRGKVSRSLQFDRAGGFGQAKADFDDLARGVEVIDRGGGLRTATLSNATRSMCVRSVAGGGQP